MIEPGTHKLVEAMEGQEPQTNLQAGHQGPPEPQGPGSTPQEVAEAARMKDQARSHGRPDREDYLVNVGRGDQTHG